MVVSKRTAVTAVLQTVLHMFSITEMSSTEYSVKTDLEFGDFHFYL